MLLLRSRFRFRFHASKILHGQGAYRVPTGAFAQFGLRAVYRFWQVHRAMHGVLRPRYRSCSSREPACCAPAGDLQPPCESSHSGYQFPDCGVPHPPCSAVQATGDETHLHVASNPSTRFVCSNFEFRNSAFPSAVSSLEFRTRSLQRHSPPKRLTSQK